MLLMFVFIITIHLLSWHVHADEIELPALRRDRRIGDLFDLRKGTFLSTNLFAGVLSEQAVTTQTLNTLDSDAYVSTKLEERVQHLGIDAAIAASISFKIVDIEGSVSSQYLTDTKHTTTTVGITVSMKCLTKAKTVVFGDRVVENQINVDVLRTTDATHVTVAKYSGGNCLTSLIDENSDQLSLRSIKAHADIAVKFLNDNINAGAIVNNEDRIQSVFRNYSIRTYCDVPYTMKDPTTVEELVKFVAELKLLMPSVTGEEGIGVMYHLAEVGPLKIRLLSMTPKPFNMLIGSLPAALLKLKDRKDKIINDVASHMTALAKYEELIPETVLVRAINYERNWTDDLVILVENLKSELHNFVYGNVDTPFKVRLAMKQIDIKLDDVSYISVRRKLRTLFPKIFAKIELIRFFQSRHVRYISEECPYLSVISQQSVFVLYTSDNFIETSPVKWNSARNHITASARNYTKRYILDCDVFPQWCTGVTEVTYVEFTYGRKAGEVQLEVTYLNMCTKKH